MFCWSKLTLLRGAGLRLRRHVAGRCAGTDYAPVPVCLPREGQRRQLGLAVGDVVTAATMNMTVGDEGVA